MHHFFLFICFIFSLSISAQGILKSKSFYQDEDFISITRSIKPKSKSLANYTAYTHSQEGATCVTHALAQGMTILYCMKKRSTLKAENSMKSFSPYFVYNILNSDFNSGLYVDETLKYVEENGNPLISIVEYDRFYPFSDEIFDRLNKISINEQNRIKEEALYFKLNKWEKINSIEGVKQSIAQGFPVLYSIDYAGIGSFDNLYDCETQDCFWHPAQAEKLDVDALSGHAMLIVGYDDNKSAVQVLNSWGEGFGNEGYFWIKYKDVFTSLIDVELDSNIWDTDHEWCWLDTGSGYCFPDGDETTYFIFTEEETREWMLAYEEYFQVTLPRGKGFGSEAYSLQGLDLHPKLIFDDDDQYVPQLMRQQSKSSILFENPDFKNSKWFMEVDERFKNQ